MTVRLESVTEVLLQLVLFLVGRVSTGHELVSRLTDDLAWPQRVWPLAGVLLVSLVAGVWTAFWDD